MENYMDVFSTDKTDGIKLAVKSILDSEAKYIYPFGISPLDIQYGGGIYSGKIYELFGPESSGKSTTALEMSKAFTNYWEKIPNSKYVVLWIETESVFDKIRAKYMGCDISKFLVCEADTVEAGFDAIERTLDKCLANKIIPFIVWDTIAAAPTKNEKEKPGQWGGGMAEKARLIRFALKKLTNRLGQADATLICVNQIYTTFGQFSSGIETPGGGGLKFHSSVRCQVQKKEEIKTILPSGEDVTKAIVSEMYTVKNKLTLPHQRVKVVLYGETGFDKFETIARFIAANKIIQVSGSWKKITFKDTEVSYQSNEKLREIIETQNPELEHWIDYLIYLHCSSISPLLKVKLLGKIWEYEIKFFGEKRTKVEDKEVEIAKMLYDDINRDESESSESPDLEVPDVPSIDNKDNPVKED